MPAGKNMRRHRRVPFLGPIRISWEDQGQPRFAIARCIDISDNGIRIEAPQPIRYGTVVMMASERIKLSGSGTVRHQVRNGAKYVLGIQLAQAKLGGVIAQLEGEGAPASVLS